MEVVNLNISEFRSSFTKSFDKSLGCSGSGVDVDIVTGLYPFDSVFRIGEGEHYRRRLKMNMRKKASRKNNRKKEAPR
jgi:hypothetical protein